MQLAFSYHLPAQNLNNYFSYCTEEEEIYMDCHDFIAVSSADNGESQQ